MARRHHSGRFLLRIDSELHERLAKEAAANMVSLNELCRTRLAERRAERGQPEAEWVGRIRQAFPVEPIAIVLFGSEARGEATASSDVDILVVFPSGTPITRALYRNLSFTAEGPFGDREINPHLVALPESAGEAGGLWFEVALEGLTIWDADDRVSRFLRRVRELIASGRVRRARSHGHPYWIREEQAW